MTDPDVESALHEAVCEIWLKASVIAMKETLTKEQIRVMEREEFPPPLPDALDKPKIVRFLKNYAFACGGQWMLAEKGAESCVLDRSSRSVLMRPFAFRSPATTRKVGTFSQRRMMPDTTFFDVHQEWLMSSIASSMLEQMSPPGAERRFLMASFTTCAETLLDVYTTALHVMKEYYITLWSRRERLRDEAATAIETIITKGGEGMDDRLEDLSPVSPKLVEAIVPYVLNPVLYEKPGYIWRHHWFDLHHDVFLI